MSNLTPPNEFHTWLDYAVATMDTRGACLDRTFDEGKTPSQDEIRAAAQEELHRLRQKVSMPWIRILENWRSALSKRLGRSAEVIFESNLLATDFSDAGVHIRFEDRTDLTFWRAFYLGETPADGAFHRVAVFTGSRHPSSCLISPMMCPSFIMGLDSKGTEFIPSCFYRDRFLVQA